jgi:glycosyltransferase involved in cell wall biosynthesis
MVNLRSSSARLDAIRSCTFVIGTSWNKSAVSEQMRGLGSELARRGHQVLIVVDQRRIEGERQSGNPLVYTWPSKRPTRLRDALFLFRLLKRHRPHCVIGNFGSANLLTLMGALVRVPHRIVWLHTLWSQIDFDSSQPSWKLQLLRIRKFAINRFATHFIANSNATRDEAIRRQRLPPHLVSVLHNSLADPIVGCQIDSANGRSRRIVCIGRLDFVKGQDVLIRACSLLPRNLGDAQLELIGEGSQHHALRHLARAHGLEGRCIFSGNLPPSEVLRKVASAAVAIVPSRSEAFGFVAVEAMAVGTPVVVSNVGGLREIVDNGVSGLLVPPDDPDSLASAIGLLLSNKELSARIGRQGRQVFLERFDLSRNCVKQADFFEVLAGCADLSAT